MNYSHIRNKNVAIDTR